MSSDAVTRVNRTFDWRIFLALWLLPLTAYCWLIGRWSLSGDEFYTLIDSSKPVSELLSYERKPLYYLLCHVLLKLNLGLPQEFIVRLPAAFAASLIPPSFYWLLRDKRYTNIGLLAGMLALFSPWLFKMSQYARFYSLAFLFASIAVLAGYRCVHEQRKKPWLFLLAIASFLAAISQLPAGIVLPATLIGFGFASFREDPVRASKAVKKYGPLLLIGLLVGGLAGVFVLKDLFYYWLTSDAGNFGSYSVRQLLMALAVAGGMAVWGLAFLPMLRAPTSWSTGDIYLATTTVLSSVPLMVFIPFGGGVSSNYLMFCLPSLFLLAATNWREIDERLPSRGYRLAIGMAILAFNIPLLASTLSSGDHHDYRQAAAKIETMQIDNPVIVASGHCLLNWYLQDAHSDIDLLTFDNGVARHLIERGIEMATVEGRPLLLVSRESRGVLSAEDQKWLFDRFALVTTIETSRFDFRRQRVSIYEYRPSERLKACEALQSTSVSEQDDSREERSPVDPTPQELLEPALAAP